MSSMLSNGMNRLWTAIYQSNANCGRSPIWHQNGGVFDAIAREILRICKFHNMFEPMSSKALGLWDNVVEWYFQKIDVTLSSYWSRKRTLFHQIYSVL
jgi:hypothetical protein